MPSASYEGTPMLEISIRRDVNTFYAWLRVRRHTVGFYLRSYLTDLNLLRI